MKSRGLFISLEGGDSVGKSTLQKGLAQRLKEHGCQMLATREPGGCSLGEAIRGVLLHQGHGVPLVPQAELLLFLAARAQHVAEQILPALEAGVIVVCDRYHDSSLAYQGYGRGLSLEKIRDLCRFAGQGLEPRLTFLLDLPPKVAAQRRAQTHQDRIESEALEFHERIRTGYLTLAQEAPERMERIDAALPPHQILEQAWRRLLPLL